MLHNKLITVKPLAEEDLYNDIIMTGPIDEMSITAQKIRANEIRCQIGMELPPPRRRRR